MGQSDDEPMAQVAVFFLLLPVTLLTALSDVGVGILGSGGWSPSVMSFSHVDRAAL